MGHKKLREEKNCLNCGHAVDERYCPNCGQENLELNDTAIHLVIHYFQDLFHYDGKLWHTLKNLILKPGLVAKEYLEGKRKQNLEPIRFYVFASTVFFLILFIVAGSESTLMVVNQETNFSRRLFLLKEEKSFMKDSPDTIHINPLIESLEHKLATQPEILEGTSGETYEIDLFNTPADTQSRSWFGKLMRKQFDTKKAEMEKTYEGDEAKAMRAYLLKLFHKLPQLFFLSLPFFAFFLKLLYWRSARKRYVEHFIFSVYHYSYIFMFFLFFMGLDKLRSTIEGAEMSTLTSWITTGMILYPFVYLFLSMKRFYNDRWGRLILRYFLLMILFVMIIIALFMAIAFITFLW